MDNCLQIADHRLTNVSGIFTIILTLIATWLAWKTLSLSQKDKQKTIAINELKNQTAQLENLFLLQIQPKFSAELSGGEYMDIVNIGGDCYNLKITTEEGNDGKYGNPFKSWDDFYSANTAKSINYSIYGDRNFIFPFEDKIGHQLRQNLYTKKRKFSNLEML